MKLQSHVFAPCQSPADLPPLLMYLPASENDTDMAPGLPGASASPTQSLDRAMALLDAVVSHAAQGASLNVLAAATGLSKPTAHRLLTGLRNADMINYHPASRLFFPSFKLYRMGQAAGARFDIVQLARPGMARLAAATGDTVYLAMRSGDFAVCLARELGSFPIKILTLNVGDRRPLGLGSNCVVLLSALEDAECDRIIARHGEALSVHPNYDPASVRNYIKRTRSDGYALNEGLMLPEMSAIAMGIRSPDGTVSASISVAAITSRMQAPRRESIVAQLRQEIQEIEAQMSTLPTQLAQIA